MTGTDTVKILKALADRTRLMVVSCLAEKPQYVEELAERLGMGPSNISFHLKKLEEAGLVTSAKEQYYVIYALQREKLEVRLLDLIQVEDPAKREQEQRMELYKKKVLSSFFKYGKLTQIPVQRKKRRIILEELAKSFEPGRRYPEREVNLIISDFHDDFCFIRRSFIEEKLMCRENNEYWLNPARPQAAPE